MFPIRKSTPYGIQTLSSLLFSEARVPYMGETSFTKIFTGRESLYPLRSWFPNRKDLKECLHNILPLEDPFLLWWEECLSDMPLPNVTCHRSSSDIKRERGLVPNISLLCIRLPRVCITDGFDLLQCDLLAIHDVMDKVTVDRYKFGTSKTKWELQPS